MSVMFPFGIGTGLHQLIETALGFASQQLAMPLVIFELAVQPSRSYAPRPVKGLPKGVQFACLAPDRTPEAAQALQRLSSVTYNSKRTDQNPIHEVMSQASSLI